MDLNNSHTVAINTTESGTTYGYHVIDTIVVPLLFGIITLVGICGNSLVVYVILSKKTMRTVINLCLLNLAIADLAFLVICPPFTAYSMATEWWSFGEAACKQMHYLLNVTVYVTIYTLVLIAIIRYLAICHSLQTIHFRTKRNMTFITVMIWIVFLALNIPVLFSYGIVYYDSVPHCEIFTMRQGQKLYATFFALAYVFPLAIIATLSIAILCHLQKQKSNNLSEQQQITQSDAHTKQASRVIIMVIVSFATLWLPLHLHLIVFYFSLSPYSEFYKALSLLWNCMAYFNSCVNPILYNYASKEFREAFREKICCQKACSAPSLGTRSSNAGPAHVTIVEMQEI